MAIADSAVNSQPKIFTGELFEQNISLLFKDIFANIRATEPAGMHDKKLVYSLAQRMGTEDLPELEDMYKGTLKRKMPFYMPDKHLAKFYTSSAGEDLTFRILDKSVKEPIETALEKHKDKFGRIDIIAKG